MPDRQNQTGENLSKVRVGILSLGCPKNQVDSEVMLAAFKNNGFQLEPKPEEADVLIINTCGFIDAAKQESIDKIIEYGRFKTEGNCKVLIAAGCLSQRYPDELIKDLPELDAVVGTGDFPKIAEISSRLLKRSPGPKPSRSKPSFTDSAPYLYTASQPRDRMSPRHWAYVKISEGCNYRCSFCAIPHFRGDLVSRKEEDIQSEVIHLASEGVKEINLIAQSLTSYGWDRRDKKALIRLLKQLTGVEGIDWIRLYYTYPTDLTNELLDLIASEPKICSYVDIPLQHINDIVLQKMNRKGDSRLIRELLQRIQKCVPGVAVRSTFIVGFPDETDHAFQELYDFIGETEFDRIGVFTYSHEDGTSAYAIEDTIPAKVKEERQTLLLNLQNEISLKKNQSRIGSVQTVLVDGTSPESGELEGRLEGQAPEIDGVVILEGKAEPGEFVKAEISDATEVDFIGSIIPHPPGTPF